jgi:hypothetical protein
MQGSETELDRTLLELAELTANERPHDPHVRWTQAQALNLLGRYAEAQPVLAALRQRWPNVALVAYHHAFACIGVGDGRAALLALDDAERRLPPATTAVARALALHASGDDAGLEAHLSALAARPEVRSGPMEHLVHRMRAASAILRGDTSAAATALLTDLEWLRQRPSRLNLHARDLAEAAEVLVALGRAADARGAVLAFDQLPGVPEVARRALAYASGLCDVALTGGRATVAEATLSQDGASAWSQALRAAMHRRRGELAEEAKELLQAAERDKSPLLRAQLARALRTAGQVAAAEQLSADLERTLSRLDLRRLGDHPLLNPSHALAQRIER